MKNLHHYWSNWKLVLHNLACLLLKDDMYYSLDKLYSHNEWIIAMILGERGVGKSFSSKRFVMNKFLKSGEQFIYLRRYKTELDTSLATFFDDLREKGYFVDHDLEVSKSKMLTKFYCDGKICGYAVPLSTCNILKSTSFPKVSTIIFDEFLLDSAGVYRYLSNHEPELLCDVIETVGRLRDIRVLMLGNNTGFYSSPYAAYWGLELPYNAEFKTFKDGLIIVQYIKNEEYRNAKKKTKFGRLIAGTNYGDYAIDNQSLRENTDFLEKRPSKSKYHGTLIINGESFGVWCGDNAFVYISEDYDPNTLYKFACKYEDHNEKSVLLTARENWLLSYVIRAYKQGWVRFENPKIKAVAQQLINKCISV